MREVNKLGISSIFQKFAKQIDAQLKISSKSDIDSGGAVKFLTIDIVNNLENTKININQTFSYLFNSPENLVIQTGIMFLIEKNVRTDFYLHFWERELIDKIFSSNKIRSGNLEFDEKFSAKSSNSNLTDRFFKNEQIQTLFLKNRFVVFNVACKNRNMEIKLKNMELKKYSIDEIERFYQAILTINSIIIN